jgi:hypothetical protein
VNQDSSSNATLFANLRALAESSFPKRCNNCGRIYATAEEFAVATAAIRPDISGLKQSYDEDGKAIVELFRNCVCGSTLMDTFDSRRDDSPAGLKRRRRFDELLRLLQARGIAAGVARDELLKLVRGQKSELLGLIKAAS